MQLQNFAIASDGNATVNTQDVLITGVVYADDGVTVLADYTGANALHLRLGGDWLTLSQSARDDLLSNVHSWAQDFVGAKAGVV